MITILGCIFVNELFLVFCVYFHLVLWVIPLRLIYEGGDVVIRGKGSFFGFCVIRGVVVIITAQFRSTKPELRLCAGSNPARDVSEIRDGVDL